MIHLQFGQRAALHVVEAPDGQGVAVRMSSGRNAVLLHLASPVAVELHRALEEAARRYAAAALQARKLTMNREAGKPLDLSGLLRRMEENPSTRADAAKLREFFDRLGLRL